MPPSATGSRSNRRPRLLTQDEPRDALALRDPHPRMRLPRSMPSVPDRPSWMGGTLGCHRRRGVDGPQVPFTVHAGGMRAAAGKEQSQHKGFEDVWLATHGPHALLLIWLSRLNPSAAA